MANLPAPLAQLADHLWPGFADPAEELRFRERQNDEIVRRLTVHAPLAIGFVFATAFGHVILFPRYVWLPSLGLLAVWMLLPLLVSWRLAQGAVPATRLYRAMQVTASSAAIGVCLVVASARAQGYPYPLPYEGILLVIMAIFLLSGLRAFDAMISALVCLVGLIAIEWVWPTTLHDAVVHTFFAIASWLLGTTFSLLIERADRREFVSQEILRSLALRDPLTGLFNRRGLDERFELLAASTRREGVPLTVAIVDLDLFKAYNDTYGHEAGDNVLAAVSGVLARHARRPLDVVARMGGEEFLLAWHDADAGNGARLAKQVCEDIAALGLEHRAATQTGHVTASIGIVTVQPLLDSDDLDSLYRAADAALYEAKRKGRNRVEVAGTGVVS